MPLISKSVPEALHDSAKFMESKVCRAVVDNNAAPVGIALPADRFEALRQKPPIIMQRDDDVDPWRLRDRRGDDGGFAFSVLGRSRAGISPEPLSIVPGRATRD